MANLAPRSQSAQDGFNLGSNFDPERLARELIRLRAWEGLVPKRVKECAELTSLARVWKNAQTPSISRLDDISAAIAMVKTVLEEELPVEYRDSLKVVYGIGVNGLSRDERIRHYLELPRDQQKVYSDSSIERYSKAMAVQLSDSLVSLVHLSGASSAKEQAEGDSKAVSREPFTMDSVQARYRMRAGRFLRDVVYQRRISCISPGDHYYLTSNVHYSDLRPGVHRLEPEFGCELVDEYYENGTYFGKLRLCKSLAAGESFEFIYRMTITAGQPCGPFILITPKNDVMEWTASIEFAEDSIPSSFWTFADANYLTSLSQTNRRSNAHEHDGSRYIRASWRNLRHGACYGIDWEW